MASKRLAIIAILGPDSGAAGGAKLHLGVKAVECLESGKAESAVGASDLLRQVVWVWVSAWFIG
jgi:hypothetical protein